MVTAVFSFIVGPFSIGNFSLNNKQLLQSKVSASGGFQIKTGYYLGTGSSQNIAIGFQPELVFIKGSNSIGSALKTTAMPAETLSFLTAVSGVSGSTDNQLAFTTTGFSVVTHESVNESGTLYSYVAMTGSDCTSSGVFCVGSYTGNGAVSQAIVSGFTPDMVWVTRPIGFDGNFRTSAMSNNQGARFSSGGLIVNGTLFQTLNADGFTVGSLNNVASTVYHYVVFNKSLGALEVGSYAGDGVAGREISGLGFAPRFVFTKRMSTTASVFTITELTNAVLFTSAVTPTSGITELTNDGFKVSGGVTVNAAGSNYAWFAFGSPDPIVMNENDPFTMKVGSYVGNGTTQTIPGIGFAPDLVFIKAHNANPAGTVFRTSLDVDGLTTPLTAVAAFSDGITQLGLDSFSVGSDSNVNENGIIYEYVVFGNATTPYKVGSDSFAMGMYIGSVADRKVITGGEFDLITIKLRSGTSSGVFKTSLMNSLTTTAFVGADNTNGSWIKDLTLDGVTLGVGTQVNSLGSRYIWFAFKENPFFKVGQYTGNGVVDTEINTVGFEPDWTLISRTANVANVHRIKSATLVGDISQYVSPAANAGSNIKSLLTNGFSLGNAGAVNAGGGIYNYLAWKIPVSGSLDLDFLDENDMSVVSPSLVMSPINYAGTYQNSSGILGTVSEKMRISNTTSSASWTVSIAATSGSTALWDSGTHTYDFNDATPDAVDGGDADSVGGRMTLDPTTATITPQAGCTTTGVSMGSLAAFTESLQDSITLVSASGSAETNCYWDITGIGVNQTIPSGQPQGTYSLSMTATIVAY